MPVLDGDGNARPDATNNGNSVNNSGNGSLAINTSKQKGGYGTITPQYIVIHNTAGGTASSNADWFVGGAGGSGNCTQFITDDKDIYQIMPPTQKARHIQGSNTSGGKGCSSWASSNAPALSQCGATNSNSIGIEVADAYNPNTNSYDNSKVDMAKAVELTIELTRYLMTQYNIPAENVVRHGDTHNKPCPNRIMELGLWPYFKEQIVKRNQENRPVSFNPATLDTTGQPVSIGNGATATLMSTGSGTTLLDTPLYASPTDIEVQLPDVDHRENNTNMDEVKGLSLIFYPPYNSCDATEAREHFALFNYDRDYHFIIGKGDPIEPPASNEEGGNTDDEESGNDGDGGSDAGDTEVEGASIQPRTPVEPEDPEGGDEGDGKEEGDEIVETPEGEVVIPEGDPVGGSKKLEVAEGFSITASTQEVAQSKGFFDNDIHTYIDRALFQNKRQKHNLTVALMCPKDVEDYPAYEKALIEGVSIILHEHGLATSDLWREFDLNRAPSPFIYLDRDKWKDFLVEVEKQLNWRIAKFGKYEKTFVPYTAGSSGLSGGSTGSISGGTLGGGFPTGGMTSTNTPITGNTQMKSENAVANTCYEVFIAAGCTPEVACGIIGNLQQESGLSTTIVNSSSGATGLCQWLGGRLTALKNYASSKGGSWTDAKIQAEWCIEELKGKDSTCKSLLSKNGYTPESYMKITDLKLAVTLFRRCFERCGESEAADTKRYNYAKNWYDQIAQVTDSGTVLPPGITDDDLEVASLDLEPVTFAMRATPRSNYIAYVGDSLTVGIGQSVPSTKTYATSGHTVSQGYNKYLSQLLTDKPLVIIMSYGTNDAAGGNTSTFVSNYKKFITKLKEGIPNVQIYINKILPGNSSKPNCTSGYKTAIKNIPSFNAKLSEIAQAGATVIDCTGVINTSTHYSNDGLHLTGEGYKLWHQEIQKQINAGGTEGGAPEAEKTSNVFGWPLPGIDKVSSKFGPRTPPCPGASSMHGGIDIGAKSGTPIMCYAAGTVKRNVSGSKSAGNYIEIDHGSGVLTRYLHMCEKSPLAEGTQVAAGQEIGKVGNTGVGTGPHLHFEIHINGEKVDPLEYVTPGGGSTGKMTNLGDAAGGGIPGTSTGGTIGAPSDGLLYDDKQQNKTDAPLGENSAGSQSHSDWGGKMIYKKGEPSDESAEQPEIQTIITQEMYKDIIEYSDFSLVDDYVQDFEPYSKGLASIDDSQISINDRATAMTKKFTTTNENTFHYKVIESGPGSKDHCVTIAEELNYLAIPQDLKVEPIYPDLVIPPGYVSTDADASSPNSIPIATIEESGISSSDAFTKQLSFDYDVLEGKKKVSNKTHHPINYTDPYPYDEKIIDLERHYPKVFIDEIEGQLYSCNHPGCPISQPMAKNFAMLSDALMNQSKRVEKRLSRIENILSTIIRNQGRLGARMNINCVYYGGHSTFNKYKCIRCLHDDRIHDGELVTIDQCLNCTRFEPILGQVYRILDDSGLNGSIILDDMQMSYTDLEGFRNLNDLTHRSSRYYNAMATEETNCKKPEKTLVELWKAADKDQTIKTIRDESADEAEAQKRIDELKEEDYIFKMDWAETFFNSQEPDTKLFPNEGIVARQKADVEGDGAHTLEDTLAELDPKLDADVIEEIKERIRIRDNIWVDTRNTSDSVQMNKYSSENFFFEDFNKVRIGKYGVKFSSLYNYNGEDYSTVYSATMASGGSGISLLNSSTSSAFASQVRDKIVEMAKKIYQDCVDGKAWYSQDYRTTEYDKPVTIKAGNGTGKTGYDCTSFVSCCYMYAGLKSMYSKTCSGGTLVREIQKGGKMIPCTKENMTYILPGDILLTASGTVTQNQCNQLQFITTSHAAIYVGNNQIIHARGKDKGIQTSSMDYYLSKNNYVFVRPADLMEADKVAAQQSSINGGSGGVTEESGTINGQNYVAKIPQAVVTAYQGDGQGANGPLTYNAHCASHNMPYGTKIYIPELAGKAGTGIFTVQDTGGCFFDFDIYTTTWSGKTNMDAYVLQWGTSSKIAESYTWAMDLYNKRGTWGKLKAAWVAYKNMNGKLVNFHKYRNEDANIKNHPNYNS